MTMTPEFIMLAFTLILAIVQIAATAVVTTSKLGVKWNAGPRDGKSQIGAYEAALMNMPMAKPDEPLEILRTIHSFDPCLACATHVLSPEGEEIVSVKVS